MRSGVGGVLLSLLLGLSSGGELVRAAETNFFQLGIAAYEQKNFAQAAEYFAAAVTNQPSAAAWQNLGNAEWENGRTAQAILAWERALRLNPGAQAASNNLKFARERAQLEAPDLTWCEIVAGWLPANWWAVLAVTSLWFAVAMLLLPGILRWRKSSTPQALVALGLGVFLLTLPANYGVITRARLGVALANETDLRFTPTAEGEAVTRLAAGEPGRVLRERGRYLFIETRRTRGWVERGAFGLVQQF